MESKSPVVLLVFVEAEELRWFAAGVGFDGEVIPLLCSQVGDLERYRSLDFDEQVAFLRHRFCGVLQRGCDRLWSRAKKAKQFVILFEGQLVEETGKLTGRIAEHIADWMLNPPLAVLGSEGRLGQSQPRQLRLLAGQIAPSLEEMLYARLDCVLGAREDPSPWEVVPKKVY